MARRTKSYEEQMEVLDVQIARVQGKLDSLLRQKDEVIAKKQEQELKELYRLLQEHNLTVREATHIINAQGGQST
ncbi:hypothetical protein [Dorea sp. D27]|uniref:hypothetical protein n=1 Tax=Dorea sp. D27 TaxID=658665 RepID=UPI00067354C9|nr:hypothetical protein [Dorea sp. D27]KMZ55346.1 hypothetical protein HMPREF0980_00694 [Dorea sp. D27]